MHQVFLGEQDTGCAENFEECGKKPTHPADRELEQEIYLEYQSRSL